MWSCRPHWFALPRPYRAAIWAAYVPGQTVTTWTPAYEHAHNAAVAWCNRQVAR